MEKHGLFTHRRNMLKGHIHENFSLNTLSLLRMIKYLRRKQVKLVEEAFTKLDDVILKAVFHKYIRFSKNILSGMYIY